MGADVFLWPEPRFLRGGIGRWRPVSAAKVEARLAVLFPGGFPILVSSGRVGIVLTLMAAGLRRDSLVGVFPFASHCVIESIGRVATPLPGPTGHSADARVIYHQWAVVQEPRAANVLIEDAVDTLCEPGSPLFPSGGRVEIWSLPKLIGSLGGGVVWCADADFAARIRSLRDERGPGTSIRWALRLAATRISRLAPFWYGAESLGGPMPSWAIGDVATGIDDWPSIVEDRRRKLNLVLPFAPPWYQPMRGRLPSVVPVVVDDKAANELSRRGVSTGYRHFERLGREGRSLARVFPVPIHQDISENKLKSLLPLLGRS